MSIKLALSSSLIGLGFIVSSAMATPITCATSDVTWNSSDADACQGAFSGNDTGLDDFGTWGDFDFLVKDEGSTTGSIAGVEFTVDADIDATSGNWSLSWAATGTPGLPLTLDFVVSTKGGTSYSLYLFEEILFESDPNSGTGTFAISFLNKGGNTPELSHMSLFARVVPTVVVPEPGTTLLLTTGIFGLVVSRKRMKRSLSKTNC